MQLKSVPKVLMLARIAALLFAFVLIVSGAPGLGLIVAVLVLFAGLALRNITVKAWVIEKLTGLPREAILEVDRRRVTRQRRSVPRTRPRLRILHVPTARPHEDITGFGIRRGP